MARSRYQLRRTRYQATRGQQNRLLVEERQRREWPDAVTLWADGGGVSLGRSSSSMSAYRLLLASRPARASPICATESHAEIL